MDTTLGEALRRLRYERGSTLDEVAEATGVSIAMLSRAERDQRIPSPSVLEKIAAYYEVPVQALERLAVIERYNARALRSESGPRRGLQQQGFGLVSSHVPFDSREVSRAALDAFDEERPSFSRLPISNLFPEESPTDSLSDASHVAEVALEGALRAVDRAMASGDPALISEAQAVMERLQALLGPGGTPPHWGEASVWTKEADSRSGIVTFTVANGYPIKERLKAFGFRFHRAQRCWFLRVDAGETDRIEKIEELLSAELGLPRFR